MGSGIFPQPVLAQLSIELCSITETLESQVAGMCTIDLFHCGSQQWLFAPQHRAPQEEPVEHAETQSLQTKRGCPSLPSSLSVCVLLFYSYESHPLFYTLYRPVFFFGYYITKTLLGGLHMESILTATHTHLHICM